MHCFAPYFAMHLFLHGKQIKNRQCFGIDGLITIRQAKQTPCLKRFEKALYNLLFILNETNYLIL
jgi:hypothetical protein